MAKVIGIYSLYTPHCTSQSLVACDCFTKCVIRKISLNNETG